MYYTVGEMAKLLQLPPSTLRYYDREGLLPFVERTESGIRMFKTQDYEWLRVIECLKHAGMPLQAIKKFIHMAREGDATIGERFAMVEAQRRQVRERLRDLQQTLAVLDYKYWYYATASQYGSTSVPRGMADSEIPPEFLAVRRRLTQPHVAQDL